MSDNEDVEIAKKLQEIQNFPLRQEGLLVGADFHGLLTRVQKLQHALFQRQHVDSEKLSESVNELTRSSKRVEKLTYCLIGLTVVLAIITGLDVLGVTQP